MAMYNQGFAPEMCGSEEHPNLALACDEYKYLGKVANDPKAAYEFVAMCREKHCSFCSFDEDYLLEIAVKGNAVSKTCQEDESTCPESRWNSTNHPNECDGNMRGRYNDDDEPEEEEEEEE